jgi:hypothetical protein
VCLGAVHSLEARLLARIGERTAAARALELATADYDAALAHRPGLAAALHDRAILRSWHATQAALALSPDARATRERAQADALAALAAAGDDHPWRERLRTLADELGERIAFGGSPGTRPAR